MSNKALITLHAVIYGVFAMALFFLPDVMWPFYGVEINDAYARFLSQHNSIFLGGVAVLAWLFRDSSSTDGTARRMVTGLLWTNALGVAITLYACVLGIFSGFGWSDPAFFGVLVLLCLWQLRSSNDAPV